MPECCWALKLEQARACWTWEGVHAFSLDPWRRPEAVLQAPHPWPFAGNDAKDPTERVLFSVLVPRNCLARRSAAPGTERLARARLHPAPPAQARAHRTLLL